VIYELCSKKSLIASREKQRQTHTKVAHKIYLTKSESRQMEAQLKILYLAFE